jgi:hypothetical protein
MFLDNCMTQWKTMAERQSCLANHVSFSQAMLLSTLLIDHRTASLLQPTYVIRLQVNKRYVKCSSTM